MNTSSHGAARKPPLWTDRLLERLVSGRDAEALIGDLTEQYGSGRSFRWFCMQAVVATASTAWRDTCAHKLATARAVAIGWTVLLLYFGTVRNILDHVAGDRILDLLIATLGDHPFVMLYATQLQFVPSGCLAFLLAGWAVGRTHASHRPAALLAFVATVLVLFVSATGLVTAIGGAQAIPGPLRGVLFMRLSAFWSTGFIAVPMLVLLGGLWNVPSDVAT